MTDVKLILRRSHARRAAQERNRAGRFGLLLVLIVSMLAAASGIVVTLGYASLTQDLPPPEALPALITPTAGTFAEPTRLYDRTGNTVLLALENPAAGGRQYASLTSAPGIDIPPEVILATLAAVDPNFWEHPGFTISSLLQPEPPTIAERLVLDLLLWNEPAGTRKTLRTRLLAAQLTDQYGREQVLEWYLNSASYGRLVYGIDAAARVYFAKSAADLNLAEAALLAPIPNAPTLNPHDTPQASRRRQGQLIERMLALETISKDQAAEARQTEVEIFPPQILENNLAADFVQFALRDLAAEYGWPRLERGGFQILTTLDTDLQEQVACTTRTQIQRLSGNNPPDETLLDCSAVQLLPTNLQGQVPGGESLSAGVVVYDPATGQILAYYVDAPPGVETALAPGRPPGTLLIPFVYLTSFTQGQSPGSLVWDIPGIEGSLLSKIPNLDDSYQGPLRLRSALANDDLSPAVQATLQTGSENVWRTTRQLGLNSFSSGELTPNYENLWQGGRANLLELLQAYGTLANEGLLVGQLTTSGDTPEAPDLKPIAILRIADRFGEVLRKADNPASRPVVSPQLAYLLTHALADESARWRTLGHPNPLEIGRPAAAKTGQTLDGKDGWTLGYTPHLAVGTWLGSEQGLQDGELSAAAANLWHAVIQFASRGQNGTNWQAPPGINTVEVCDPSGMLPSAYCPNIVSEVFASGNEPTQVDNLYRPLEINRESGLLATVNTPPELIEERVYLMVPPEAQDWAAQAGLPTPPEDYDVILSQAEISQDLSITDPQPFETLRGEVEIKGSATGRGFDYYRLQAGAGLNPQSWIQISADQTRPVREGLLGTWDTQGLEGLYVIQLQRISTDQRIETATMQVTLDNQPPDGTILFPQEDQEFEGPLEEALLIQVEVQDNLGIDQVQFSLDGRPLGSVTQPPYVFPFSPAPGKHTLTVDLFDLAGNQVILETNFSVTR